MCIISECPKKTIHKQRCTKTIYDIIFLKFTETLQLGYFLCRVSEWTDWPHTSSYADATAQKDSKGACRVPFTKANALVCYFQAKWLTWTDFTTSSSTPVTLGLLIFAHKQTNISNSKTVLFLEEATLTRVCLRRHPSLYLQTVAKAAMGNFQTHFALRYLPYIHSSLLNLLSVCKTWKWIKPLDVVAVPRISNVAEGLEGRASV